MPIGVVMYYSNKNSLKLLIVFLAFAISCSNSETFDTVQQGGSSSKGETSNSPESEKPTDDSEGLPGYLVDPEAVAIEKLRNGNMELFFKEGALSTASEDDQPVMVIVHLVKNEDFLKAATGPKDVLIDAKQVFKGLTDQAGILKFDLTVPAEDQLVLSFAPQQKQSIKILNSVKENPVMAFLLDGADPKLIPITAESFFGSELDVPEDDASADSEAEAEDDPECTGLELADACWYQGTAGQSCTAACADHGGYNEATKTYAGSEGNLVQCKEVLNGLKMAFLAAKVEAGTGVGCGTLAVAAILSPTPTTSDGVLPLFSRACACNN
jgi:hypothetical protein